MTGPVLAVALLVLGFSLAPAHAQIFFASRPEPQLAIAPLFVRATVRPDTSDVPLNVLFSVAIPPERSALDFEQPLYLLWPGAVAATPEAPAGAPAAGAPGPGLAAELTSEGFKVVSEGRLALVARRGYEADTDAEVVPEGAPFVTVVRPGGPLGQSAPATYIRIPWTPKLANRAWLMDLRLTALGLVTPKVTPWLDRLVRGPRSSVTLAWGDVGPPAMFTMYFWRRERTLAVLDPSQLIVAFTRADALAIDEVAPRTSRREQGQVPDGATVISLFLERPQGLMPQTLSVDFGYFSRWQAWGPVLVPVLFFVLGNIAGVLVRWLAQTVGGRLAARLSIGRTGAARERGVVLTRDRLARIVPGETTYAEILELCGRDAEESEGFTAPDRKTLVYRGQREVPQRAWSVGWLSRVAFWNVEHHEVTITIDGGIVRDVQASVRRARLLNPARV